MGRDNHPRIRQAAKWARKRPTRQSYDRILIVCEGSKTEPQYFEEIRQTYKLSSTNIEVVHSAYGTSPRKVTQYALDKFASTKEYDQIFVVFDRDDHADYYDALDLIEANNGKLKNSEKNPVPVHAIASIPCFELWLLLHYEDVHCYKDRTEILKCLKKHIPDYDKGKKGLFDKTSGGIPNAIKRAKAICDGHSPHDKGLCYTNVFALVMLLHQFAKVDL